MRKGWIMTTRLGLSFDEIALEEFWKFFRQEERKVKLGPFHGPWEMKYRLPPGQDLRKRKKDLARRKDDIQIRDVIGKIFYKKKLRFPIGETSLLGWVRKPKD
jgi:pyruvate-formate lyase-activating enzyme